MAERMMLAFGRYLKLVRERRKLSLEDVTALTKSYPEPINKGYLSRVERGLARIGFSKMVAVARAYDVPLDAFGEKLALDLEVDQLKDAPDTRGKTFGELTTEAMGYGQRGLRWHRYACVRDALPRAGDSPLFASYRDHAEQVASATLSFGIAANGLARYNLALSEFRFVLGEVHRISDENAPILFQQLANSQRHLGLVFQSKENAARAVALAERAPKKRHLGDAIETQAHLASSASDHTGAIGLLQQAFAAYKAVDRRMDCARTLTNLAQKYFDVGRTSAARRSLGAADRLAAELGSDSVRSRVRVLLGEIEFADGNKTRATALWHEAQEIARQTHDTVVHFKAEFQLFKLAILQNNRTIVNALGRRLERTAPWISADEPEVVEFRDLYAVHRKPKQRGVAIAQHGRPAGRNPGGARTL